MRSTLGGKVGRCLESRRRERDLVFKNRVKFQHVDNAKKGGCSIQEAHAG